LFWHCTGGCLEHGAMILEECCWDDGLLNVRWWT
jgi:hypothetical protein